MAMSFLPLPKSFLAASFFAAAAYYAVHFIINWPTVKMGHLDDDRETLVAKPHHQMKVIAAGLPRCATTSLQRALQSEWLDCDPTMHMKRVALRPERTQLVIDALGEEDKQMRQKILHKLFDGYAATCDVPGVAFTADLMDMYPDAKIILNQRANGLVWGKSVDDSLMFFVSWFYRIITLLSKADRLHVQMHLAAFNLSQRHIGIGQPESPEMYRRMYDEYNQFVRDEARKRGRDVLEWQPQDGWAPICEFLGKPVPPASVPFPRCNDTQSMKKIKIILSLRGLCYWVLLCAGVWVAIRLITYFREFGPLR
ncbi:hypothetical protein F5B22DRAFT_453430 [Xylaria bambusicola]|uniref:uncharacterized protein n=1 Tax=Xylaria bambusicola TaxID=326684 RepID=UPI00200752BF|nr:uncharacterized protein F5B22DRAFT_453430 [Xylaria bambusicola]KAI0506414.1 hypothetical protein F5B22DRAFT_453430 [Xylaria bambusicola]